MPSSSSFQQPLVFIAGALRSGSTLLTLMMARHPALDCPGEFDYLFDAFPPDCGIEEVNGMSASRFDDMLAEHQGFMMRHTGTMEIGPTMVDRLCRHVAALRPEGKTLALCLHRDFVTAREVFPSARFLHLLRDPRDCARSAMAMGWAGNVYHGLGPWLRAEESWDRVQPQLRPDQYLEVRYEELVAEPQQVLTRICQFLGLPFAPQMLDLSGTTYETPSVRFANQWRRSMSLADEALIVARVGELMRRRGYEPRPGVGGAPGYLVRCYLCVQDRWMRHRFRQRRYGTRLYLRELLTRKLGWVSAHRAIAHDILEVDKRYMK